MSELQMIAEDILTKFMEDELTFQEAQEMLDSLGIKEIFKSKAA